MSVPDMVCADIGVYSQLFFLLGGLIGATVGSVLSIGLFLGAFRVGDRLADWGWSKLTRRPSPDAASDSSEGGPHP